MRRSDRFALQWVSLLGLMSFVSGHAQEELPKQVLHWPAEVAPSGTIEQAQVGYFTGDRLSDALVRKGNELVLLANLEVSDRILETGWQAFAFTAIDGLDQNGKQQGFATADGGLYRFAFGVQADDFPAMQFVEYGSWSKAPVLMKANFDGSVEDDLLGVDSARSKVMVKRNGHPTTDILPVTGSAISSVAVGYYLGNPTEMQIAMVVGNFLEIHSPQGGPVLRTVYHYQSGGKVVAVWDQRQGTHRFAWQTLNISGSSEVLYVVGSADWGPSPGEGPVDLGNSEIQHLSAFDWDQDGDDEVAFVTEAQPDLIVLDNNRSDVAPLTTSFLAGDVIEFDAGPDVPTPANPMRPLVGDLNDNLTPDVLLLSAGSSADILWFRERDRGESGLSVGETVEPISWSSPGPTDPIGRVETEISLPANADFATFDHLEILVFHQDSLTSVVDPNWVVREVHPLSFASAARPRSLMRTRDIFGTVNADDECLYRVSLPLSLGSYQLNSTPEINNMVLRLVSVDAEENTLQALEPMVLAVTLDSPTYLELREEVDFQEFGRFTTEPGIVPLGDGGAGRRARIVPSR